MIPVIFYPDRCVPPLSAIAACFFDSIRLKAGINQLSEKDVQKLQEHPDFQRYLDLKAIEIVQAKEEINPAENTEVVDLKKFAIPKAQEIVLATHDIGVLEGWLHTETRKDVRATLNTRIAQIKAGED